MGSVQRVEVIGWKPPQKPDLENHLGAGLLKGYPSM